MAECNVPGSRQPGSWEHSNMWHNMLLVSLNQYSIYDLIMFSSMDYSCYFHFHQNFVDDELSFFPQLNV
jgi:hypothetical protein